MQHKTDIALAYRGLRGAPAPCRIGDDCAAIPDGDGFLLFAIEGLLDEFVEREPWFAGYCAVMVNLSDIAAMGGRATAVVDALWATSDARGALIFAGMRAAADAYNVPIVGGHTNARSTGDRLAVSIVGRAQKLLTSFDARPGDRIVAAVDLRGAFFEPYPYWNCSTTADAQRLRGDLELLPALAEAGLCRAAKDISMGGILGTLLMLLECSGVGAAVDIDAIPKPSGTALERWLTSFPSYGYLLAVAADDVQEVRLRFTRRGLACAPVGTVNADQRLVLESQGEREPFWDFAQSPFTGAPAYALR